MTARFPRRRRRLVAPLTLGALATLAVGLLAVEVPTAVGLTPATEVPVSPHSLDLTATAADFHGLVYGGLVTLTTPAGDVPVMKLTSTSASLTSLQLRTRCVPVSGLGGMATDTLTADGSTSTASGGFTLLASSVTGTAGGAAVTWTPASPPPAEQLGDVSLTDLTVEVASLDAPTLTAPGLRQSTSFCSP